MKAEQSLHDKFWQTRLDAKAAYKLWKAKQAKPDIVYNEGYYLALYQTAWQLHQEANTAQFLAECEG